MAQTYSGRTENKRDKYSEREEVKRARDMTTVVKGVLNAIREKGLRPFLRELKEEGYAYVLYLSFFDEFFFLLLC